VHSPVKTRTPEGGLVKESWIGVVGRVAPKWWIKEAEPEEEGSRDPIKRSWELKGRPLGFDPMARLKPVLSPDASPKTWMLSGSVLRIRGLVQLNLPNET
jgi:hypothetical protein